jgi:hypothetical protein
MKKWIGLMALVTAANSVLAANLYEPFNYTAGTSLDNLTTPNGEVWALTGSTTGPTTIKTASGTMASTTPVGDTVSPDFAALAAPQGNIVQWGESANTGWADRINFGNYLRPNTATNTSSQPISLYYSMEFRVDSITDLTTAAGGAFIAGFNNLAGTQSGTIGSAAGRLVLKRDNGTGTSPYSIGINTNVSGAAQYIDNLNVGQDYFIVVQYTLTDATNLDDVANLWLDPNMATFGTASQPAPNITATGAGMSNGGGFSVASFFLRQTASNPLSTSADEIRIGTSWAGVTAVEWESTADNSWSTAGDWSNTAAAPNAVGADVTFGTNSTVQNVNLTSPQTVGVIRFNTNNYTIAGTSTLTLDQPTIPSPSTQTADEIVVSGGTDTISAPLQLNKLTKLTVPAGSTLNLTGGVTAAPGISLALTSTYTTTGTLTAGGTAVITPASTSALSGLSGLTIATGKLQISPAHAVITTTAFTIGSTSTLDLTNNDLIVDYAPNAGNPTGTDATTGPAVVAAVLASYDGGLWDKAGITTSLAPAGSGRTLAVVDNEALATPLASVDSTTLDSSSVVVKYTWFGDLNLDGVVNAADLALMGTLNSTTTLPNWASGDLNYDGVINADDYALFQLGLAASGGANISVTPEPSSALGLALIGLLAIRRRKATCR